MGLEVQQGHKATAEVLEGRGQQEAAQRRRAHLVRVRVRIGIRLGLELLGLGLGSGRLGSGSV